MPRWSVEDSWGVWRLVRDVLLFTLGAAGLVFETVWAHPVDQPVLVICAGMVGLPAVLAADRKRNGGGDDDAD